MALNLNEPNLNSTDPMYPKHLVKWTRDVALNLFNEMEEWFNADENRLFIKQFCAYKKISSSIIDDLVKKYPENKETYTMIKELCETRIALSALHNKTNTIMSIFVLKNCHQWVDKNEMVVINSNDLKIKIPGITEIEGEDITGQKRLED
jgi:hypothetical protein